MKTKETNSIRETIEKVKGSISLDSVLYGLALQREKARNVMKMAAEVEGFEASPPEEIAYFRLLYLIAGWLFRAEVFGVDLGVDPVIKSALEGPDGDILCKYYPLRLSLEPIENFKFYGPEDRQLSQLLPVAMRQLKSLTSRIERQPPRKKEKIKVLVADDSPEFRRTFVRLLQRMGYKVSEASSGEEVMKLLDSGHFDVLFLDVDMPHMNGDVACSKIRNEKEFNDLPVFLITGFNNLKQELTNNHLAGQDMIISKDNFEKEIVESLKYFGLASFDENEK